VTDRDADPAAHLDNDADRGFAAAMPFNTAFATQLCPPAISIHDDGDVLRQTGLI